MVKCPFCGFDNEDGALFCEQCKSDLSSVPAPAPSPEPVPVAFAEAIAVEAIAVEAVPVEAIAVEAIAVEAVPIEAIPVEAVPVEATPVVEAVPVVAEAVPVEDVIPAPLPQLTMPIDEPPVEVPAPVVPAAHVAPPAPAVPAPVAAVPAPAAPAPAAPAPAAPAAAPAGGGIPPGSQLKLVVQRGLRTGVEFPIYPDYNYIGRSDDKPVDIDLDDQEAPDRVWCSRQHAVLHYDDAAGVLTIEDLNSSNGTYVNRARVYPGQKISLNINDVIQIGTVHLKLRA